MNLTIEILPQCMCIARYAAATTSFGAVRGFYSWTQTEDECSLVCEQEVFDKQAMFLSECLKVERNYRLMRVAGVLDFSLTGILAALAVPLAKAKVPIFALSTFDTDYILCKEVCVEKARDVLRKAGFLIEWRETPLPTDAI